MGAFPAETRRPFPLFAAAARDTGIQVAFLIGKNSKTLAQTLTLGGSFCSIATGMGKGNGKKPSCLWKWFFKTSANNAALFTIFFFPASAGEGTMLTRQATSTAQHKI